MEKSISGAASQHVFALDLVDDAALIAEYERYHAPGGVWPEILDSIRSAGVVDLRIYRVDDRMIMIMSVDETFSFEAKTRADLESPMVQRWETLMWRFQKALPAAEPGEKWRLMRKIFDLADH